MTWIVKKRAKICRWFLFYLPFWPLRAREGTETREHIDDTVKELAGKKNIDRMDQMKKDINKARQQQADRFEKDRSQVLRIDNMSKEWHILRPKLSNSFGV